jgi:hypothetical protein
VFEVSTGVSLPAWKLVRWLYVRGAGRGIIGRTYGKLRSRRDYNKDSLVLSLLTRSIRRTYANEQNPIVVAHPTLVAALRGKDHLFYQHGELVAPHESLVRGAAAVFVPTQEVAEAFLSAGYNATEVIVTGLCIEPSLVKQADDAFQIRVDRINRREPLTGAFYSSGAEPRRHVDQLLAASGSAVESGGKVILFGRRDGRLIHRALRQFDRAHVDYALIDSTDFVSDIMPQVLIVSYDSRREETIFTSRLYPYFDYFVAPSHERSNWALGLGLPMFVVGPCIGPFAPLNRDIVRDHGVAEMLGEDIDSDRFGELLTHLRHTGRLTEMAINGWHKFSVDGFEKIAHFLVKACETDLM